MRIDDATWSTTRAAAAGSSDRWRPRAAPDQRLASPDLRERLSGEALEPMPMSPEQFGRYMRDDIARWSRLAKERNIEIIE